MNEQEHLLTVLSEECAEVAQRACKAIRFGLSEIQPGHTEDNKRRLERELADLMATADLLGLQVRDEDKAAKVDKLKKYMGHSREIGTLEAEARYCVKCGGLIEEGSTVHPRSCIGRGTPANPAPIHECVGVRYCAVCNVRL